MSAHTPGPWHVTATPQSSNQDFIVAAGKWAVASIDYCEASEANARLIAAAPDLLAVLRLFAGDNRTHTEVERLAAARAAIAKATGSAA